MSDESAAVEEELAEVAACAVRTGGSCLRERFESGATSGLDDIDEQ